MKKTSLLFSFTLSCLLVSAQSFTVVPNPANGEADLNDPGTSPEDVVAHSYISNNTSDTLFMKWERVLDDKPECWETAVCDVNLCYFPWVSSKEFTLLPNLSDGDMLVHAYPDGYSGESTVKLKIFNLNDPADSVVVTYNFTVAGDVECITNVSRVNIEKPQIYPNPTADYFRLTGAQNVERLVIYDVLGKPVRNMMVTSNQFFNIKDLSSGSYYIVLFDKDKKLMHTLRLHKI